MTRPPDLAVALRDLHFKQQPLVLPNVWDVSSAVAVAAAGAPVIGTSSAAVAASLGLADQEQIDPDTAFAVVQRIASAVDYLPVTADIEGGYGLPATELAERLIDAGAVGCNLEDSDHRGPGDLVDVERQAQYIAQLRAAGLACGVDLVINARVDSVIRQVGTRTEQLEQAIERSRIYLEAGATCVYPIGISDEPTIRTLVEQIAGPLNIWLRPDSPSLETLTRLRVARVSLAGALHAHVVLAITTASERLLEGAWPIDTLAQPIGLTQ